MADTIFTLRPADRQCAVWGSGLKMSTVVLPPGTTMRLAVPAVGRPRLALTLLPLELSHEHLLADHLPT